MGHAGEAGENVLAGWQKVVRAADGHRTRFHTLRDTTPASLREWADVPVSLLRRLVRRRSVIAEPWLAPSAVRELGRLLQPTWRVLEIGAGASTAWFAPRCGEVTSLEPSADWHARVTDDLRQRSAANATVRHVPFGELAATLAAEPQDHYDLVLVDAGDEDDPRNGRVALTLAARRIVRPGGYLVLDNSDRRHYHPVDEALAGWQPQRYVGMPPSPLTVQETTIFQRPQRPSAT